MSSALPEIDAPAKESTVGEVFHVWGGGTPTTTVAKYWDGTIPWATSADLDDDFGVTSRKSITEEAVGSSATHVVQKDSLLVATRVGLGKVGIATEPTAYSQDCQGLTPKQDGVVTRFAAYQLKLRTQEFRHISRGTTIAGVTKKQLLDTEFLLPETNIQQVIADDLDLQFSRLDAGIEALKRAQGNLKRYRASVLQAACEGRLVPTEHALAQAEGRDYETGEQLLERILTERRQSWTGKGKYKEPIQTDVGNRSHPPGWTYATVDQVSLLVTDGDHNPPKRVPSGVPHLTARNIKNWAVSLEGCTHISEKDAERVFKRYEPLAGDLIITCVGTIGRTAIVPAALKFSPDRNLAAIRVVKSWSAKYLNYVLSGPAAQEAFSNVSGSTAQPHLYLGDLRAFTLLLPPLAEQVRIVAEVERRLSVVDQLEKTITANLSRATRLRQAILKKAFTPIENSPGGTHCR
jgi:type I restriction enzyme S subunit